MRIKSLAELRPLLERQPPERRRAILEALKDSRGASRVSEALDNEEKRRGSKFGNEYVRTKEGLFHSKGEFERFCELAIEQRAGIISDLQRQVEFPLAVAGQVVASYFADFVYRRGGATVVEDFKGYRTDIYKLKKKIFEAIYKLRIFETGKPSSRKAVSSKLSKKRKPRRSRARRR